MPIGVLFTLDGGLAITRIDENTFRLEGHGEEQCLAASELQAMALVGKEVKQKLSEERRMRNPEPAKGPPVEFNSFEVVTQLIVYWGIPGSASRFTETS